MKRMLLVIVGLLSFSLSAFSCLIPAYTANYKFTGKAEGVITQTLNSENGYTFQSNIKAHKLFFKAHIEKLSQGKIVDSGFETSFFHVKESMNNTEYKVSFDKSKNKMTLNQSNKKYYTDIPKGDEVIGEVILPMQLRLMLLKDNDLKQAKLNVAFHGNDTRMVIIPLVFNIANGDEIKTPLASYKTKILTTNYSLGKKKIELKYWFADNKDKIFIQSEFFEAGSLKGKSEITKYDAQNACVVKK
ncbi:MAG: hypothetical protein ACJA0H_001975 [Francisellaceae bacterium]|jgi:hypothetical protein